MSWQTGCYCGANWSSNFHPIRFQDKKLCLWLLAFRERWRIPIGKLRVGSVVSHKRKSGWGLVRCSNCFSNCCNQWESKWQFCSISHWPRAMAVSRYWTATFSWPCPIERNFILLLPNSILSASLMRSLAGSEPGLRMNTIGDSGELCSKMDSKLKIGGVTYFSPMILVTYRVTAL